MLPALLTPQTRSEAGATGRKRYRVICKRASAGVPTQFIKCRGALMHQSNTGAVITIRTYCIASYTVLYCMRVTKASAAEQALMDVK